MQRRMSRISYKIEAEIKTANKDLHGEVCNLSLNGMFVNISDGFKIGDEIKSTIHLSTVNSEMSLNLAGDVVRIEPEGVAVQFKGIELDTFILLRNIVIYNNGNSDLIDKEFREYIIWNSSQQPDSKAN